MIVSRHNWLDNVKLTLYCYDLKIQKPDSDNNGLFQKLDEHPPKKDMGIPNILTTFFIGKSQKIKHFFGCKGKEGMVIPKIYNHL